MGTDAEDRKWPEGINPKTRLEQLTDDELLTIAGWAYATYRWQNTSKKEREAVGKRMSAGQMRLSEEQRKERARKAGLAAGLARAKSKEK